jgi:hypothetical protein
MWVLYSEKYTSEIPDKGNFADSSENKPAAKNFSEVVNYFSSLMIRFVCSVVEQKQLTRQW